MILFQERPYFEDAWAATSYRVIMGGMGDDTIMMIAELYERGYEPDEVVFCDTGSEFPHTYKVIEFVKEWMAKRNWSKFTHLKKYKPDGSELKLIDMVEEQKTLPAAAFGHKSCSLRFKTETADVYFNNSQNVLKAIGSKRKGSRLDSHTGQMLRIIGINADEPERAAKWQPEHKWLQVFPLYDWDIGERESTAVERVGLYYPGKSSCVMCPHLSKSELQMLQREYPEIFIRVLNIETAYRENQMTAESTTIGLCRGKTIAMKMAENYCDSFESQKCGDCK